MLWVLGMIWILGLLSCSFFNVVSMKNFKLWGVLIHYNSPIVTIIPFQSVRESAERFVVMLKSEEEYPSQYKLCLFSLASCLSLSVMVCLLNYSLQIHQLPGCPTFEGSPGRLVTANLDVNPFPWKLPCILGQDAPQPNLLVGEKEAYDKVLTKWNFNPFTGFLISRVPESAVAVELRLTCMYGLFHWSCGVLHQPNSIARCEESYVYVPKVHNAYPEIENPVQYAFGVLILSILIVIFCFFCFWALFCLGCLCCCGFVSALGGKRSKDEL